MVEGRKNRRIFHLSGNKKERHRGRCREGGGKGGTRMPEEERSGWIDG